MKRLCSCRSIFLSLISGSSFSQAIDNHALFRAIREDKYVRFNYENDYFTRTDYYYTQGVQLEWVHPVIRHFPLVRLLAHPRQLETQYGMALEHNAYTPQDYISAAVQQGDRPFAAALFLKSFLISTDRPRKQRFSSLLSTGVIGPTAGGYEIQESIHRWTNNPLPQGWHNQIANDLVLNYELRFEKQLLAIPDVVLLEADASARAGTLSDRANIGIALMSGDFTIPFQVRGIDKKKFQFFGYDHPVFSIIGYDASLEGGLFNHHSIYTIPSGQISRFVFRNDWGFILEFGNLYLEYSQVFTGREFINGLKHRWGRIQLGFRY